jgi:glutamate synthase (NADPH) small chain
MDFLRANTKTILDNEAAGKGKSCLGTLISAMGKEVVVIGGGDTGTDCVGTCIRQGCSKVVQLEIMPKLPDSRTDTNPWPEWPMILKTDYGQQEAITKFGKDPRRYRTTAVSFHGDANGAVESVNTIQVQWEKGKDSRLIPCPVPGTEKRIKARLVLLAMGFLGPDDLLPLALNLKRDARSNVQTLDSSYMTDINGVFAAGDMRRGQSLVVWAIHEGRAAAKECDRYLMGETFLP